MMRYLIYPLVPFLVLLTAVSLACILAYFVMLGIGDHFPLRKIISKSSQILLVLSIFPAMKILNINRTQLGFAEKPLFLKQLLQGFVLGFFTLIPVFIVLYVLKINVIDDAQQWTASLVAKKMLIALFFALIISLIEEPLFRGILITGLNKKLPVIAAILISSIYYAGLHFLDSHIEIPYQNITWFSGFTLMSDAFTGLLNPEFVSTFLALFMVGIFLAGVRTQIKSSLGLCIGCHTCWVWQIKMSKSLFNTDFNSPYAFLVSHYDGVIGPLVTGWLMLALVFFWLFRKKMLLNTDR
ncbi:MAG: CPBP family intramembrane metalloprotease [Methylococcaceae bacterium]|nr:CPBP family intramembrane metalloprotease [Methylococcaceae bacterium]